MDLSSWRALGETTSVFRHGFEFVEGAWSGRGSKRCPRPRNAAHLAKEQWLACARWRKRVERALSGSGLNFRQWLVLDATRCLIKVKHDAVSQNQIGLHLELERQALSEVIPTLERMGLVRRAPTMSG